MPSLIELNHKAVVEVQYGDGDFIRYSNDHPELAGQHAYGMASVMYDVLNRIALDSQLGHARAYEADLALDPIKGEGDDSQIVSKRG